MATEHDDTTARIPSLYCLYFDGTYGEQFVETVPFAICSTSEMAKKIAEDESTGALEWKPIEDNDPALDDCYTAKTTEDTVFDTGYIESDVVIKEWMIYRASLNEMLPIMWMNMDSNFMRRVEELTDDALQ